MGAPAANPSEVRSAFVRRDFLHSGNQGLAATRYSASIPLAAPIAIVARPER
jgi:hypothetical protein